MNSQLQFASPFYVQQSRTMKFNFWRFIQRLVKLNSCNRKVQLEVSSKNLGQSCNALSRYFQTNWLYTWLLLRKNASCRGWYPRSVSLESRCLLSLDLKRTTVQKWLLNFCVAKPLTIDITNVVVTNHVVTVKPSFVSPSLMEVSSE